MEFCGLGFTLLTVIPVLPPLHDEHAASCLRRYRKDTRIQKESQGQAGAVSDNLSETAEYFR